MSNLPAIAVDIGGTNTRVAVVDPDAKISNRVNIETMAHLGKDSSISRILNTIESVITEVGRENIAGVGICMPGPMDPITSELYDPPNLPGWDGVIIKPIFQDFLKIQVNFDNDANIAAMGELKFGAGKNLKSVIYITLGTGIGCGIAINGRMYGGRFGYAGELGHTTIDRNGPKCNCGNIGCLEVIASGTAMARIARERLNQGEASELSQLHNSDHNLVSAAEVAQSARNGDKLSLEIVEEIGTNLGIGIVNTLHIFDPEIVIIGGGMAESMDLLKPSIEKEINAHAIRSIRINTPPIVTAALGEDASILGAASLIFENN